MKTFRSFAEALKGRSPGRVAGKLAEAGMSKYINGFFICKDVTREAWLNGYSPREVHFVLLMLYPHFIFVCHETRFFCGQIADHPICSASDERKPFRVRRLQRPDCDIPRAKAQGLPVQGVSGPPDQRPG
jgi:hypothetical protein